MEGLVRSAAERGGKGRKIALLRACRRLGLSSNELDDVPEELSRLEALETFDLYNNRLRRIPGFLGALPSLKKIFVKDCGLNERQLKRLQEMMPQVLLSRETPPELYLQLR